MEPVYITKATFDEDSPMWSVPCGAGMFSCLTGYTVDHWVKRILNYRKRCKRYTNEFTSWESVADYKKEYKRGTYWTDESVLYFSEAMYFLKPYKPRNMKTFKRRPKLRRLMEQHCDPKKTYIIWFDDPGHVAIIHKRVYWDNDSEEITLNDYNDWYKYRVKRMVEITPEPLELAKEEEEIEEEQPVENIDRTECQCVLCRAGRGDYSNYNLWLAA